MDYNFCIDKKGRDGYTKGYTFWYGDIIKFN